MLTKSTLVYISHTRDDERRCSPLLNILDSWQVEYWFDQQEGGARQLSTRAQKALSECTVLLRICTRATNRSYSMSLEAGAILSLQAEDHRAGRNGRRTLVNLIIDPEYRREPFDSATPTLDATDPARFVWVNALRDALALPALQDAEATTVARRVVVVRGEISRRRVLALGVTGALVAVAAGSTGALIFSRDHSSAVSASATPRATPPSADPTLRWYTRVVRPEIQSSNKEGVGVAPILAGGTIFTGALDSSIFAVDATTGTVRWQKEIGDGFFTAPSVGNGVVYACSHGGDAGGVVALDAATGQQKWLSGTAVQTYTKIAFANGRVYVSGFKYGAFLAGLNAATGKEDFEVYPDETERVPSSQILIAGNVAYLGSFDGYLYAVDLSRTTTPGGSTMSAEIWRADIGAAAGRRLNVAPFFVSGVPTVANGIVYVGSEDQYVYAFDAKTGEPRWNQATTGQIVRSSPIVAHGILYIGSDDMKLYAFEASTGKTRWVYQTAGKVRSSPVVANGIVYVGSDDAYVHGVDMDTGSLVRKYATADAVVAPPVISDNILYAADIAGYLYTFNLS